MVTKTPKCDIRSGSHANFVLSQNTAMRRAMSKLSSRGSRSWGLQCFTFYSASQICHPSCKLINNKIRSNKFEYFAYRTVKLNASVNLREANVGEFVAGISSVAGIDRTFETLADK